VRGRGRSPGSEGLSEARSGPIRIHPVVEGMAALIVSAALSVYLTWPLVLELGDHILGLGGDSTGTIAGLRIWAEETGYSITGTSRITSAAAPFGYEQGDGVNLQSAFVFFPAYLVTELAGEIAAYNLVVVSGLTLSGGAMYWLTRWLGCHSLVAAWAGLVFIVFPWHLEKAQGHSSLVHLEGFPLLLLAVFAWYRSPNVWRALLIAGAAAILWTTSGYFGFMGLAAVLPLMALAFIFHARGIGMRRALGRIVVPSIGVLAVPALVYAVASTGATDEGIATPRGLQELVYYGARPWEYLIPSYRNRVFGDDVDDWLVAHLHGSNFSETTLYVGWLTIVLSGAWLVYALVKRAGLRPELRFATAALAVTVATGLVFSLPTPLPRTDIPTPVRLIWEVAPQFRVPARFVALVMAALVPLAALALERVRLELWRRVQPRWLAVAAGSAACVVAGAVSFLELSILPPASLTDLSAVPAEYESAATAPRGLLAEYPLAPSDHGINSDYLFWQGEHGRAVVNGAPLGTFPDSVRQTLVDPAATGTPEALAMLGVSTIIVRPNTYAFTGGPAEPRPLGSAYRRVGTTANGTTVWEVTARPARAIAVFGANFHGPETATPRLTMRWMDDGGEVELYSKKAGRYGATFTVASYARPRRLLIRGANGARSVAAPTEFARASIPIVVPRGRSTLTITADPGPESLPDGRSVSVYMSNWRLERDQSTTGGVPLRAKAR
jgi:hypothetical protein